LNRWVAWLAILAVLVHGLIPMGAAWASSGSSENALQADLHQICTANGLIQLDGDPAIPSGKTASGSPYCSFCLVHSLAVGTPATAVLVLPEKIRHDGRPVAARSEPDTWLSDPTLPRGPPVPA
jgi:hypothetical protein